MSTSKSKNSNRGRTHRLTPEAQAIAIKAARDFLLWDSGGALNHDLTNPGTEGIVRGVTEDAIDAVTTIAPFTERHGDVGHLVLVTAAAACAAKEKGVVDLPAVFTLIAWQFGLSVEQAIRLVTAAHENDPMLVEPTSSAA